MRNRTIAVAATAAAALLLQTAVTYAGTNEQPAGAVATHRAAPVSSGPAAGLDQSDDEATRELYRVLSILENIPDDILANGDAAARDYVNEQLAATSGAVVQPQGVVGCVAAIGAALLTIIGPLSKIKAAVRAAGGALKLARKLNSAYKEARRAGFGRGDAVKWARNEAIKDVNRIDYKEILLALTGGGAVIGECFE